MQLQRILVSYTGREHGEHKGFRSKGYIFRFRKVYFVYIPAGQTRTCILDAESNSRRTYTDQHPQVLELRTGLKIPFKSKTCPDSPAKAVRMAYKLMLDHIKGHDTITTINELIRSGIVETGILNKVKSYREYTEL